MSVRNLLPIVLLLATGFVACTGSPTPDRGNGHGHANDQHDHDDPRSATAARCHRHVAHRRRHRIGNRVFVPVHHAAVGRRSAVHRVVELRRWRGRGGDGGGPRLRGAGQLHRDGDDHRQQGDRRHDHAPCCGSHRDRPLERHLLWNLTQAGSDRHRPGWDESYRHRQRDRTTGLRPEPGACPIRGLCR